MSADLISWAPKIPPGDICRLYESDARGILDEELMDGVAYAFYSRCLSILEVTRAAAGTVCCPSCRRDFHRECWPDEELTCPHCGWECSWRAYHHTYRGRQLHGGGAVPIFQHYVTQLPRADSPRAKMLLIDWLIHQCHEYRSSGSHEIRYTRPVATNLIRGSLSQILAFLDELAEGAGRAPGSPSASGGASPHYPTWRTRVMSGVPGAHHRPNPTQKETDR